MTPTHLIQLVWFCLELLSNCTERLGGCCADDPAAPLSTLVVRDYLNAYLGT
jgi:hypothetical protein